MPTGERKLQIGARLSLSPRTVEWHLRKVFVELTIRSRQDSRNACHRRLGAPDDLGVEARDELTAQERRIAQLATGGLSNPKIGARLFLTPRTVEWHLRKVFAKSGPA